MVNKKARSLELYMKVGALMRLKKEIENLIVIEGSKILPADESHRFIKQFNTVDAHLCDVMEEQMFSDYPELSNEYLNVFYNGIECTKEFDELINLEAKRFEGVK